MRFRDPVTGRDLLSRREEHVGAEREAIARRASDAGTEQEAKARRCASDVRAAKARHAAR